MPEHAIIPVSSNFKEDDEKNVYLRKNLKRRSFLKLATVSVGCIAASPGLAGMGSTKERGIYLYNPRTDEAFNAVYWTPQEGYLSDALKEISWVLRDHRTDQVKGFDPKLLDQLYILQIRLEAEKKPLHIVSGYRSPNTNAMLRQQSKRVAKNSFHMYGKAVDMYIPNRSISALHRAALSLKAGGVGYYPRSHFIHVDTGPIRAW